MQTGDSGDVGARAGRTVATSAWTLRPGERMEIQLPCFCLEYDAPTSPNRRIAYTMVELQDLNNQPAIQELLDRFRQGDLDQRIVQLAAWHVCGVPWETLAGVTFARSSLRNRGRVSAQELTAARQLLESLANVGGAGNIAAEKNHLDVWQTPAIHGEVARLLDALTKMSGVKQNESTAKKEIGKTIVVTEGKAPPEALTVIVYDVTNLVRTGDYDRLVSSILRIEETTWQDVGGPGVCEVYPSAKALVIVQTTAVHRQICDWLRHQRQ